MLQIVLGVGAALVLNEMFPGRNLLRAIVIFPYVVPTVVAVILWKWLLNSQFGLINYMLEDAGLIDRPISWMGRDWIMVSLILVSVWQFFPFVVIGVLARLQIDPERALRGRDRRRRQRAGSASATSRCRSSGACCS